MKEYTVRELKKSTTPYGSDFWCWNRRCRIYVLDFCEDFCVTKLHTIFVHTSLNLITKNPSARQYFWPNLHYSHDLFYGSNLKIGLISAAQLAMA
jgi:hypothetical protein